MGSGRQGSRWWLSLGLMLFAPVVSTAQDRNEVLHLAPGNVAAALWTDDLSVASVALGTELTETLEPLNASRRTIESLADRIGFENDSAAFFDDLETIREALMRPLFEGPAIALQLPDGAWVIAARTDALLEEIEAVEQAIGRLTKEFVPYAAGRPQPTFEVGPAIDRVDVVAPDAPDSPRPTNDASSVDAEDESTEPRRSRTIEKRLVDGWLLVADDSAALELIAERITTKTTADSLLDDRTFRIVRDNVPRGESGSLRFHLSAAATRRMMLAVWNLADPDPNFVPAEVKPIFWDASGLDEVRGFGGQWTLRGDDTAGERDGDVESETTRPNRFELEAFASQGAPFRGWAAGLDRDGQLNVDRFIPDGPRLKTLIQVLVDGDSIDREIRSGADRFALALAEGDADAARAMLNEPWEQEQFYWSPGISSTWEAMAMAFGADDRFSRVSLRFDSARLDREDFGRLIAASYSRPSLPAHGYVQHHVEGNVEWWQLSDAYIDEYIEKVVPTYAANGVYQVDPETGEQRYVPQQLSAEEAEEMREMQARSLRDDPNSHLRRKRLMIDGWVRLDDSLLEDPTEAGRSLDQIVTLHELIDDLRFRTDMTSQPAFLIASWPAYDLPASQVPMIADSPGAGDDTEEEIEAASALSMLDPKLIGRIEWLSAIANGLMAPEADRAVSDQLFGGSVILGGVTDRGFEIRARFGMPRGE